MDSRAIAGDRKKLGKGKSQLAYQHEAGVYLLPSVGYSYASCGETGDTSRQQEQVKAVSVSNFNGAAIVRFIKKMNKHLRKKLTLIWDGAKIHTCRQVKDFLQAQESGKQRV